jgi:hypothetical protein
MSEIRKLFLAIGILLLATRDGAAEPIRTLANVRTLASQHASAVAASASAMRMASVRDKNETMKGEVRAPTKTNNVAYERAIFS